MEADAFAGAALALGGEADRRRVCILTNAAEDVRARPGPHPLVVFNHGGALDPLANMTLMETLASNGYVAASIGHAGESSGVVWLDGSATCIEADLLDRMRLPEQAMAHLARLALSSDEDQRRAHLAAFLRADPGTLTELASDWADDAIALADLLAPPAGNRSRGPGWPVIDGARIAYAGMSLGGSAAFTACRRDPRAAAGVDLDGIVWDFAAAGEPLRQPFLELCADSPEERARLAEMAGAPVPRGEPVGRPRVNDLYFAGCDRRARVYRLSITGAGHADFTDGPVVEALLRGAPTDAVPVLVANSLCRAFLDSALGLTPWSALDDLLATAANVQVIAAPTGS